MEANLGDGHGRVERVMFGPKRAMWRRLGVHKLCTHTHPQYREKKLEDRALAHETVLLLLVRVGSEFHHVFLFCETYFGMWKKYTRLQVQVKGLK